MQYSSKEKRKGIKRLAGKELSVDENPISSRGNHWELLALIRALTADLEMVTVPIVAIMNAGARIAMKSARMNGRMKEVGSKPVKSKVGRSPEDWRLSVLKAESELAWLH
jgi:hypothetical protein